LEIRKTIKMQKVPFIKLFMWDTRSIFSVDLHVKLMKIFKFLMEMGRKLLLYVCLC